MYSSPNSMLMESPSSAESDGISHAKAPPSLLKQDPHQSQQGNVPCQPLPTRGAANPRRRCHDQARDPISINFGIAKANKLDQKARVAPLGEIKLAFIPLLKTIKRLSMKSLRPRVEEQRKESKIAGELLRELQPEVTEGPTTSESINQLSGYQEKSNYAKTCTSHLQHGPHPRGWTLNGKSDSAAHFLHMAMKIGYRIRKLRPIHTRTPNLVSLRQRGSHLKGQWCKTFEGKYGNLLGLLKIKMQPEALSALT
ncbi:hypothetical protein CR513_33644, partial [Mucuna pruriens]